MWIKEGARGGLNAPSKQLAKGALAGMSGWGPGWGVGAVERETDCMRLSACSHGAHAAVA